MHLPLAASVFRDGTTHADLQQHFHYQYIGFQNERSRSDFIKDFSSYAINETHHPPQRFRDKPCAGRGAAFKRRMANAFENIYPSTLDRLLIVGEQPSGRASGSLGGHEWRYVHSISSSGQSRE